MKAFWEQFKEWMYRYLGGLFMEEKNDKMVMSIGRVSFAVVLGVLIWVWYRNMAYEGESMSMPPGLMEAWYTVASYVFGSKVVGAVKGWKNGNGQK